MTQALYLVTKTLEPGQEYINGITAVLINLASGQTNLQAITAAIDAANATELYAASNGNGTGNSEIGGLEAPIQGTKYFDTVVPAGAGPGSANLFTNKDAYVFKNGGPVFIAGGSYT